MLRSFTGAVARSHGLWRPLLHCAPLASVRRQPLGFAAQSRALHATSSACAAAAPLPPPAAPSARSAAAPPPSPAANAPRLYSPNVGLPVRADLPEYSWEEIYEHDSSESYWIVMDGFVYDLTEYVQKHPGGGIDQCFSRTHGTDAGEAFAALHGPGQKRLSEKFLVGRVREGSVTSRVAKPRPKPNMSLELEDLPLSEPPPEDAPSAQQTTAAG